jgi:hypothetical protein
VRRRRIGLLAGLALVVAPIAAVALTAGVWQDDGGTDPAGPSGSCPAEWRAEWQGLADRIDAPVYCPGWLPAALASEAHHASVDADGSYQAGFHDPEVRFGDIHVVVARYPGTEFPRCTDLETRKVVPCANKPTVRKRLAGLSVTLYERTWGHEANHLLYAWTYQGSLYTASIHRDRTVTRAIVLRHLERVVRNLERIDPGEAPPSDMTNMPGSSDG